MNIAENLENSAFYFPDNTAIIEDDHLISYRQINEEANRIATALLDMGVKKGDRIGICAPNSPEWVFFYFGVLKTGAVAVTFSYLLKTNELLHIIHDSRPRILFTNDEKLDDPSDIFNQGDVETVISKNGDITLAELSDRGSTSFKTIDCERNDTAVIIYTGGTTGIPKGALLTHENIQTAIHNVAFCERSTESDLSLCFLPLNHVFAQMHIMNATIYSAGGIVLQPSFDMDKIIHAIKCHKITKFFSVPTIYIRLLEHEHLKEIFSTVRYCFSAAASMAKETIREWKKRTGLKIYEAYGLSESASIVTYNHYYRHVAGSIGTPVNLVEIQIRDTDGKLMDTGQKGEICIRGPNITKGYLNKPKETKSAFWNDWFRSGDIGVVDKNGYIYIVDRLKEMIITGGENVYPREIEEVMYKIPEILECAVVGLPDKEYGEQVTAFIVPKKNHSLDFNAIKQYLKNRLAPYKVPKKYIATNELPKNNAGKLLKREIKEKYIS